VGHGALAYRRVFAPVRPPERRPRLTGKTSRNMAVTMAKESLESTSSSTALRVSGGRSVPTASDCAKMSLSCACYNLRRASRAVTQLFDAYFDEVGLKATQFTVLSALAFEEERAPTIGELAETLVLEQSSLSRNLAVLERLGFIRLVPGPEDRRERLVTLLRTGRLALARGFPVWCRAQAAIAEALEGDDLDVQLRALRRLTKTAQDVRPRERRRQRSGRPSPP
jgi:DNA-binding MarR family transcriptional regulator